MKRPSPGFEQNQTDCLPAARLPGKEGCMKNNQNIRNNVHITRLRMHFFSDTPLFSHSLLITKITQALTKIAGIRDSTG